MKDLISIIVPVFKAHDYIEKCAESLLSQTYDNIEYFFVNDCTPDDSIALLEKIVDKFPERKPNVNIINMETNQGHANCRNNGLNLAKGKYCIQIDSDDYVDVQMIEKMHKKIEEEDADICCCDFYWVKCDGISIVRIPNDMVSKSSVANYKFKLEYSAHWNKLIRTSLIKENNIYCIKDINNWVDIGQTLPLRLAAKKIVILHEPLYFYNFQNPNSVSRTPNEKRSNQMMITAEYLDNILSSYGEEYKGMAKFLRYNASEFWALNGRYKEWREKSQLGVKDIMSFPIKLRTKLFFIFACIHLDVLADVMLKIKKSNNK